VAEKVIAVSNEKINLKLVISLQDKLVSEAPASQAK
jgi:hypothetical protein